MSDDWKGKYGVTDEDAFKAGIYGTPQSTYDIGVAQEMARKRQQSYVQAPTHTPLPTYQFPNSNPQPIYYPLGAGTRSSAPGGGLGGAIVALFKLALWLAFFAALLVGLVWVAEPAINALSPSRPLQIVYGDSANTLRGIHPSRTDARMAVVQVLNRLRTQRRGILVTATNAPLVAAAWTNYQSNPRYLDNVVANNQFVLGYWFAALLKYQIKDPTNAAAWHDAGMLASDCSRIGYCDLNMAHRLWLAGAQATHDPELTELAHLSGSGWEYSKEVARRTSVRLRKAINGS
jgi:hypothetical protein